MRRLVDGSTYNIFRPKIILGNFYNIYQAAQRERAIRKFRNKYCPNATLYFSDHHRAHAASAYYCSGVQDALVVTCDNLGDTLSHTAWSVKNGSWTHLVQGDGNESLGAFYGAVTEALGFKPNQHEGKIVGLAAYADGSKKGQSPDWPLRAHQTRDDCGCRSKGWKLCGTEESSVWRSGQGFSFDLLR
jgi:carbamoyltransferase